jgi:hypothetical protein
VLSSTMVMPPWIPSCVLSSTDDRGESHGSDEKTTEHFYSWYRVVVACFGVVWIFERQVGRERMNQSDFM